MRSDFYFIKKATGVTALLIAFLLLPLSRTLCAGYNSVWGSFSSSSGDAQSVDGSYLNVASIGQAAADSDQRIAGSTYMRLFAGILSSEIKVQDVKLSFADPSPSPDKWNDSFEIECSVTIISYVNNIATNTVAFRISSEGIDEDKFSEWIFTATGDKDSGKEIRYSVVIPTAPGGVSFAPGSNNYIQWQAYYEGGVKPVPSGLYNIKIIEPGIEIVQPGDISSIVPSIEIDFTGPVQPDSMNIKVSERGGPVVLDYNPLHGSDKYEAQWPVSPLNPETYYVITASVRDTADNEYEDSAEFKTAKGVIADLIPVPSPADIGREDIVIRYVLGGNSRVCIAIYDVAGRLVREIISREAREPGIHTSDKWDGRNYAGKRVANGVYFCEVKVKSGGKEYRRYTSLAVLR